MDIYYHDKKQEKLLSSPRKLNSEYGHEVSIKLQAKLFELRSVDNLEIYAGFDNHLEYLTGQYKGKYSVRITKNIRLIFEQYRETPKPLPRKEIKEIRIFDVRDYHRS